MLGARATWALWARPRPSEAAPVRGWRGGRAAPWAGAVCGGCSLATHLHWVPHGEGPEDRTNL